MAEAKVDYGTKRVAVVTGSNKGIGLETCRQLASNGVVVVLTARDEKRGTEAVENLKASGLFDVVFRQLDVTDPASVASMAEFIKAEFGKLDILVNNAAISGSNTDWKALGRPSPGYDDIVGKNAKKLKDDVKQSYEEAEACLRTNYLGVKLVTQELVPLLELSDSPRIVNLSSILGQLKLIANDGAKELSRVEDLTEEKVDVVVKGYLQDVKEDSIDNKGWPAIYSAYIVSKAALNAYTRVMAKMYPKIYTNAVSPGYVKTDLNHHDGVLTVEEGAKGPVRMALMPDGGPSGLFYDQIEVSSF